MISLPADSEIYRGCHGSRTGSIVRVSCGIKEGTLPELIRRKNLDGEAHARPPSIVMVGVGTMADLDAVVVPDVNGGRESGLN